MRASRKILLLDRDYVHDVIDHAETYIEPDPQLSLIDPLFVGLNTSVLTYPAFLLCGSEKLGGLGSVSKPQWSEDHK